MSLAVARYDEAQAPAWDAFVRASRNGTFLLERAYMDYHRARFADHSLLLRDAGGGIVALLPANGDGAVLHSHAGLTYGGLVLGPSSGAADAVAMLEAIVAYLPGAGFAQLRYKTIPSIYHRQPAEDDRYALFRAGATLSRRDVLSVVPRTDRLAFQSRRTRGAKAAAKAGARVVETREFAPFWAVLTATLRERFGVDPVHSLAEIELLAGRFPRAIRLFGAQLDGETVAGCVVFETERVAHVQYIAASEAGRRHHALDGIFSHLLAEPFADKPWFDFGISNEQAGRVLNTGLVEQKEGFGARTMVHDFYELNA